jgi:hypothetical protein
MSCNVVQATLQSLFPAASTLTITRALNTSLTPGGSGAMTSAGLASGDGMVWAQLWYNGTEQFYCKGSGCGQTVSEGSGEVNVSTWICPTLNCVCRPGTEFCGVSYLVRTNLYSVQEYMAKSSRTPRTTSQGRSTPSLDRSRSIATQVETATSSNLSLSPSSDRTGSSSRAARMASACSSSSSTRPWVSRRLRHLPLV